MTVSGTDEEAVSARRRSIGARRNPLSENAILDAAEALLAERGYAGCSIDEVARRAGAGKPTIYRRWPTKAQLYLEVYARRKDEQMAQPDTGSLAGDLETLTRDVWQYWRETPAGSAFAGAIAEAQADAKAMHALKEGFLRPRLALLRETLARSQQRGEIGEGDVRPVADALVGFWWHRLLTGDLDEAAIAPVTALIAAGAAARAKAGGR